MSVQVEGASSDVGNAGGGGRECKEREREEVHLSILSVREAEERSSLLISACWVSKEPKEWRNSCRWCESSCGGHEK